MKTETLLHAKELRDKYFSAIDNLNVWIFGLLYPNTQTST